MIIIRDGPTFGIAETRVCIGRKFSFDWGHMRNLAFIATTILNLGWLGHAGKASPKF